MSGSGQLVSVGIVTWNSRGVIRDCLRALVDVDEETGPFPSEIVVVDNGSKDGTADLVETEFPAARVERHERNLGFAAAANRIVRETRGEYLLLLNPDCRIRPGYLSLLVDALRRGGDRCGAAAGKLLLSRPGPRREDAVDSAGLELTPSLRVRDRGHGQPDRGRFDADEEVFGVCAAAALYRRSLLDDLARRTGEVFDESFGSYKEDADLAWRARRLGWSALYVAEAVADHRRGFAAHRRSEVPAWLRRQSFRNRYLLLMKNASIGDLTRRLPFVAAFEIGALCYALVRDRALLGAYVAAARLAPAAWAKRRLAPRRPGAARPVVEAPLFGRPADALAAHAAEGIVAARGGDSD